jgi:hypothetical protein
MCIMINTYLLINLGLVSNPLLHLPCKILIGDDWLLLSLFVWTAHLNVFFSRDAWMRVGVWLLIWVFLCTFSMRGPTQLPNRCSGSASRWDIQEFVRICIVELLKTQRPWEKYCWKVDRPHSRRLLDISQKDRNGLFLLSYLGNMISFSRMQWKIYVACEEDQFIHCWSVHRCAVYKPDWVEYVIYDVVHKPLCSEMIDHWKESLKYYTAWKEKPPYFRLHVINRHSLYGLFSLFICHSYMEVTGLCHYSHATQVSLLYNVKKGVTLTSNSPL